MQTRLFVELAHGRRVQVLARVAVTVAHADEPAGERPRALERMLGAPDEESAQLGVDDAQGDDVDRDRRSGIVGGCVVPEKLGLAGASRARVAPAASRGPSASLSGLPAVRLHAKEYS